MLEPSTELERAARQVLRGNHVAGWTKPSASQYPHQWNWDSGFISLGWATFEWETAATEIESMLHGQWSDGMVPHVRYDPRQLADYFPGPDRWPGMERHVGRAGELTSGISNPPILALAARRIGARAPDPERRDAFWRRVLPDLARWLEYFFTARRLAGCPLVAIVHPWETGWDNSPRWDRLRQAGLRPKQIYERLDTRAVASAERPTGRDYDSYIALAEIISEGDFALAAYRDRTPFVVYDAVFDALVHRAGQELNRIAEVLGEPAVIAEAELAEFARAYDEYHWHPHLRTYVDWDAQLGEQMASPSAAGIAALSGGLSSAERVAEVAEAYLASCGTAEPICTVPPGTDAFEPSNYWRGPAWIQVNWLVIDAFREAGLERAAASLTSSTLRLVERSGFGEYFNPIDRTARGSQSFSWTAALVLDLLHTAPPKS